MALPGPVACGSRAPLAATIRPMTSGDLDDCVDVLETALDDLYERSGQPRLPRASASLRALLAHLLETDPGLARVAEAGRAGGRRIVAFGNAYRRERFWYLAFLFVRPEAQRAGLGRSILRELLPAAGAEARADGGIFRATCVEAFQPVSTALYARHGLLPRGPLFSLTGRPRPGSLPALEPGLDAVDFETLAVGEAGHRWLLETVERLDREVLGFARPTEHRLWRREGRRGWLFQAADGPVGYGYVRPSGKLGPLLLCHPALAPGVLGHLFRALIPPDSWQLLIPGDFGPALVAALAAGLRIDGPPGIVCGSSPLPGLDRYVPSSFGLL